MPTTAPMDECSISDTAKYRAPAFKVCIIQRVGIVLVMLNEGLYFAAVLVATPEYHHIGRGPHSSVGSDL
jgi:hypothetical protein